MTMHPRPRPLAVTLLLASSLCGPACSQGSPRTETPQGANNAPAESTEVLGTVGAVTLNADLALDARDALRRRD